MQDLACVAWCQIKHVARMYCLRGMVPVPRFATTAMPSPELSSDIQRALQQAVGQANNVFTSHQLIDQPRTAKRRRNLGRDRDKEPVKQKTRKVAAEATHASPREPSSISATHRSKRGGKASSKPNTQVVPDLGNTDESPVLPSPSQSQSPGSFLDAVVSAASATSAHAESPYSLSQPCFDPQSSSSYPYPTMPNDPPMNAGVFQSSDSFSSTNVPDLNYASNEDILRALQDLDVTKIATVLKTLGEAAAAANVPLTSLPSTLLQRLHPTPVIDSTLSNSTAIAESSAPRVLEHRRRLEDISKRRESLELSDHAKILATKWLSANKLAELAKTQGQRYTVSRFA